MCDRGSVASTERLLRHYEHNFLVTERMEPGDMIEFKRSWYSHWGVCVGGTQIVHLTGYNDGIGDSITNSKWDPSAVSMMSSGSQSSAAVVQQHEFWDIIKDSKAEINNEKDRKCQPLHPEMIVQNALSKIGEVGYNMLYNNCEHFAAWCRYGIGMSEQVERFFTVVAFGTLAAFGVGLLFTSLTRPIRNRIRQRPEQNIVAEDDRHHIEQDGEWVNVCSMEHSSH